MRRTSEDASVTRESLLTAALEVFTRQGYSGSRLEDVAAQAGVTRGAIYHHFRNKADLYGMLIADAAHRIEPVVETSLGQDEEPLESLRRFGVEVLALASEDSAFRAVAELILFRSEVPDELAEGLERKKAGSRALLERLAGVVARGQESGEVRDDVDAMDVALGLVALQNGLLSSWLIDREHVDLASRSRSIIDIFLAGAAGDNHEENP